MPVGPVAAVAALCLLVGGWGAQWACALRLSQSRQALVVSLFVLAGGLAWRGQSVAAVWLPLVLGVGFWFAADAGGHLRALLAIGLAGLLGAGICYILPPGSPGALNIYFLDAHYPLALLALVTALVVGRRAREQIAIALLVPLASTWLEGIVPLLPWNPVRAVVRMVGSDGGSALIGPDWWVNAPLLATLALAVTMGTVGARNSSRRTVIFRRVTH